MRYAAGVSVIMSIKRKLTCFLVNPVQNAIVSNPQISLTIFERREDEVLIETVPMSRLLVICDKARWRFRKPAYATAAGANPDIPFAIFAKGKHKIVT